jgi:hypothetical protein
MLNDARQELMQTGSLRLLCVGRGKKGTELGDIDCKSLVSWNQSWGVLPSLGEVREKTLPGAPDLSEVTIFLPTARAGTRWGLSAGDEPRFLESGWNKPEGFGTWTEGNTARMAFMFQCPASGDVTVTMDFAQWIGGFVADPPPVTVTVALNGKSAATWRFKAGDEAPLSRSLVASTDQLRCDRPNELTFAIDRSHSPSELGFSPTDKRHLGLAVRSISFLISPQPEPS